DGALRTTSGEGEAADGSKLSDHCCTGGRSRRVLDSPSAPERRHRKPRRGRRLDCNIAPAPEGKLWSEGLFRHFENRRQIADMRVWPDTLAERRGRSRTGSVQSRQPATANNIDPTRLAMAAQSAALSSQRLVSRTGKPERRPPAQDNHRRSGAKATGRALEIRDRRCHYRGRYDEGLTTTPT